MVKIDLNSDLGEHPDSPLDEMIMPFISSCNIACGGHIGNQASVLTTIDLAIHHSVAIGAHPSFPDKDNFGRVVMHMDPQELKAALQSQIALVIDEAKKIGTRVNHVKPHGALYNLAAKDESTSSIICEVIQEINPDLYLYGLAHSVTETVAKAHEIRFVAEAFADRKYAAKNALLSRSIPGAVLSTPDEVVDQANELVFNQRAMTNGWVEIQAKSICLHSDTEGAVDLARLIKTNLEKNGAIITSVQ